MWLALQPLGTQIVSVPDNMTDPLTYRLSYYRNEDVNYQKYGIEKNPDMIAPVVSAEAAIVLDLETGSVLWHKNAYKPLPIASITKLMSVLVVLKHVNDVNELVTFSEMASEKEGSRIGVDAGEQFTVQDLLEASLVRSANDAIYALSEHVSGTSQEFVSLMNKEALDMHLGRTKFANPVGYDNEDNFSTAFEVTIIARELLKYPGIRDITSQKTLTIYNNAGKKYELKTTNQLLNSYLNVYGLKTGTTEQAGQSFVALGTIDDEREIMVVVLNSGDRFQEAKVIFDWTERAFTFN
jgi:D-alanyl-D-alanine carboxypeptidase (penicillin-binding protein 5/6)